MKILVALLIFTFACGGGYAWIKPDLAQMGPGASIGKITGRHMYLNIREVPARYQRLEDPITGPVYLFFGNNGYVCSVTAADFTMARENDMWSCKWRVPRGI